MARLENLLRIQSELKELIKAERDSLKACERRAAVQEAWTRPRMTTANARWATLAEYRDRVERRFADAVKEAGY